VYLRPGTGDWKINGKTLDDFFPGLRNQEAVARPFVVTGQENSFSVMVRVRGGGLSGQAGAIQLGVARAIVAADEEMRGTLRSHGLLTRDARVVERKKPGRPKARKRFQFSKR
jgi:small subunit ribosomal protein S9